MGPLCFSSIPSSVYSFPPLDRWNTAKDSRQETITSYLEVDGVSRPRSLGVTDRRNRRRVLAAASLPGSAAKVSTKAPLRTKLDKKGSRGHRPPRRGLLEKLGRTTAAVACQPLTPPPCRCAPHSLLSRRGECSCNPPRFATETRALVGLSETAARFRGTNLP